MTRSKFGIAAMLGVAWFAAALVVLQAGSGEPRLDTSLPEPVHESPAGWLLALGTAGHVAGNVALGFGLYRSLSPGALRGWATGLFLLAAGGFAIAELVSVELASLALTALAAAASAMLLFAVLTAWR